MKRAGSGIFMLVLFLMFCFVSGAQASKEDLAAADAKTAKQMVLALKKLFEIKLAGNYELLSDPARYKGTTSHGKVAFESEDSSFFKETGEVLRCRTDESFAEVIFGRISEPMHNALLQELGREFGLPHYATYTKVKAQYINRSARLEGKDFYYEIVYSVDIVEGALRVSLGAYWRSRAKAVTTFTKPDALWKVLNGTDQGKETLEHTASVTLDLHSNDPRDVFGKHTLSIRYATTTPVLIFEPRFYPMWSKKGAGLARNSFLKSLDNISIDGAVLKQFSLVKSGEVKSKQTRNGFVMELDDETLKHLKSGSEIQFEASTVLNEKMVVVFPLSGSREAIEEVEKVYAGNGYTRLMEAVASGDYKAAEEEILSGADPSAVSRTGRFALEMAVSAGDAKMIRILGRSEALDPQQRNRNGDAMLHVAAQQLRGTEVLDALIEVGADLEVMDKEGRTPMLRTVCYRGVSKYESLFRAGAVIRAEDRKGRNLFHYGALNPKVSEEVMSFFMRFGVNGNAQDNKGDTPLMLALKNGNLHQVRFLVDNGARLDLVNNSGDTVLEISESYRDSSDLTSKLPLLARLGKDAEGQAREFYKNMATVFRQRLSYRLGFRNKSGVDIQVAVNMLKDGGYWVTRNWFRLKPGDESTVAISRNRVFYYYAESRKWETRGTDLYRTLSGKRRGFKKITVPKTSQGKVFHVNIK